MHDSRPVSRIGAGGIWLLALLLLGACGQAGGAGTRTLAVSDQAAATATPAPGIPGVPGLIPPGRPTAAPGTAAPAPTATSGPLDPYSLLDPLAFLSGQSNAILIKQDFVDLDGHDPPEVLLTVSSVPGITSTEQVPFATLPVTATRSSLAVAAFSAVSQTWTITAHIADPGVPGQAVPLPRELQGQNLLGTNPPTPILQLRTETTATVGSSLPSTTLYLYAWKDGAMHPLPMRPSGATADQDAVFTATANVQLIDIDNDGRAEVVVDDGAKTTVWKWDGTRFVPR
jgi:hypothetical protein